MSKLFVSLPMRDRDEIDILETMESIHELMCNIMEEDFELINNYVHVAPESYILHESAWYLAESISQMAEADLVVFHPEWKDARGCIIEHATCALYDIPYVELCVDDFDMGVTDVVYDYTHDLDEQPVEVADEIDILHEDDESDFMDGNETLAEPDINDEDEFEDDENIDALEPGEYDADAEL